MADFHHCDEKPLQSVKVFQATLALGLSAPSKKLEWNIVLLRLIKGQCDSLLELA